MLTPQLSASDGCASGALSTTGEPGAVPELPFSQRYTAEHALEYFQKHETGFTRRCATLLERHMVRRALARAGQPASVLDLPCGTGRFWPVLAERPDRIIHAADLSEPMMDAGLKLRPPELVARVRTFQASAFAVPRPDRFVECVLSVRLLHHIEEPAHRVQILREFARVASQTVLVSLWVDGNYQAWRWRVRERRLPHRKRLMIPRRVFEAEAVEAGLRVIDRVDFLPRWSMWSTYVLGVK